MCIMFNTRTGRPCAGCVPMWWTNYLTLFSTRPPCNKPIIFAICYMLKKLLVSWKGAPLEVQTSKYATVGGGHNKRKFSQTSVNRTQIGGEFIHFAKIEGEIYIFLWNRGEYAKCVIGSEGMAVVDWPAGRPGKFPVGRTASADDIWASIAASTLQ